MNKFKISMLIFSSIILFACNKTESIHLETEIKDEYENIKDLSNLPPIQGVPINNDIATEKYTDEIDHSCNSNIMCNIENAFSHYDAMNKDLQRNSNYQPVYHQNINGIFALQCGSDLIKNIARYRISNEIRIDVITRNGEHFWCKGGYNLVSFFRGRRVKYMDFNNTESDTPATSHIVTDTPNNNTNNSTAFTADSYDGDDLSNVDFNDSEFDNEFGDEFEIDCKEMDCQSIDNDYNDSL